MNYLLINLRENKKISRRELATMLDVSLSMVEKVERGVRRASPDLAQKWGNKLGLKEFQLYEYFFTYKPDNMSQYNEERKNSTIIKKHAIIVKRHAG